MFSMSAMKERAIKPIKLAHPDGRRRPSLMKKSWFQQHRRLVIIIAAALVATVVAVLLALYFFSGSKKVDIAEPDKPVEPTRYYSPLTGRETTEPKTTAPVLAVMIENSPDARPQSGLTEAGVVFEAIAEGGITRFIVFYQEVEPTLIGPVRSVRPYYLDWAAAFDAGIAHVGGSDEAIRMVRSGNYGVDLDQFANDAAFWRSKDRRAPHNVYTDYAHLSQLAAAKGKTSSKFTGFTRQDIVKEDDLATADNATPPETEFKTSDTESTATTINLAISSSPYAVSYQYDAATKTYQRSVGGRAHLSRALDKTDTAIAPDVVIAMHVSQTLMADRLHNQITTTGSGEVFVFQDGQVTKGTWTKSSVSAQLRFLDSDGQEIKLKRGQTWLTAVPNGKAITWQ
jgi:hypothetical protein